MAKKKTGTKGEKPKTTEPRISLCMMVKDEERLLPQCLESAKDVVDEIVVVDTGSTDRTVEIAEGFGARVFHHPWENDFSKHRNESISYAKGLWILIMDADEELDSKTKSMIRPLVKEARTGVISFNVRSYLEDGAYYSEGSSPRLFKNGMGFHYKGRVHNQLILKDKLTPSSVVLWHYGYDLGPEKKKAKLDRSLALLREQAKEWPEDIPTRHHLAMTLLSAKDWEEAHKEAMLTLDMAAEKKWNSSQLSWTYFVAATSLIQMERFDEADEICRKAIERFDWAIDIHHCLSQINFVKKDYEKVLEHGSRFLELCEKLQTDIGSFPMFQFETVHRDWVVYRSMGYSHMYLGMHDQGVTFLEKALERVSKNERLQLTEEVGRNLLKVGQKEKALEILEKLPLTDDRYQEGLKALAGIYEELGRKKDATRIYGGLMALTPLDPDPAFKRGVLLLELHEYQEAAPAFEAAFERKPGCVEALVNWGLSLEKQELLGPAEEKYRLALEIDPESPRAALNLGLLLYQAASYADAMPFLKKALSSRPKDLNVALALSTACMEAGDIEAMLEPCECLLKALELSSDKTLESLSDLAHLYLEIARKLLSLGRMPGFTTAVEIGLRLGPESIGDIAGLARDAMENGQHMTGLRLLEKGLLLSPGDRDLMNLVHASGNFHSSSPG